MVRSARQPLQGHRRAEQGLLSHASSERVSDPLQADFERNRGSRASALRVGRARQQPSYRADSEGPVDAFQAVDVVLDDRLFCTECWQWLASDEKICPSCQQGKHVVPRKRSIKGWLGIQRYLDENEYGLDFLRHGRKIEIANKDLFVWQGLDGEVNEPEYPIDDPRNRGRIVGEIHLDHCRVHYTKDRFDRNDRAWEDMLKVVRGSGPLRPEKARDMGLSTNHSPLYRLFQVFRRSSPKPKIAGAWRKVLAVPDNDMAKEFAAKFHACEQAYELDTKWWELIEEEERKLLAGPPSPAPTPTAPTPPQGPGLPGFGPGAPAPTPAPTPPPPPRSPIASLSRTYHSKATSQKWPLRAFKVESGDPALTSNKPWVLHALTNGPFDFLVDVSHPIFASATMTPLDGLLAELAWSAMDFVRSQEHAFTFASVLAELRDDYAKANALEAETLSNEARQTLTAIAVTLPQTVEPSDAPILFKELALEDQKAILTKMATRGATNPQAIIAAGRFLEFAPPRVISAFFSKHPELFLDGNCWDDPFAELDYQDATATEVARTQVLRRYESLLSDAVWLCEQDPADLAQASRPRLLRAMHALELLAPIGEEDAA